LLGELHLAVARFIKLGSLSMQTADMLQLSMLAGPHSATTNRIMSENLLDMLESHLAVSR
jgi:hypothetical protein